MAPSIYDTHVSVKRLTEAGMPLPQAEAVVNEQVQLLANTLATKDELVGGLNSLETKLDHKIELVRADIRTMEARLPWQIAAIMATLLGIFAAVFKLFVIK